MKPGPYGPDDRGDVVAFLRFVADCPDLTAWERKFVAGLLALARPAGRRLGFTARQLALVNDLASSVGVIDRGNRLPSLAEVRMGRLEGVRRRAAALGLTLEACPEGRWRVRGLSGSTILLPVRLDRVEAWLDHREDQVRQPPNNPRLARVTAGEPGSPHE